MRDFDLWVQFQRKKRTCLAEDDKLYVQAEDTMMQSSSLLTDDMDVECAFFVLIPIGIRCCTIHYRLSDSKVTSRSTIAGNGRIITRVISSNWVFPFYHTGWFTRFSCISVIRRAKLKYRIFIV